MGTYDDRNPYQLPDQGSWSLAFEDTFNGTGLDRGKWPIVYGGSTYWNGAFSWSHSDVKVGNGELTVSATKSGNTWTAGGLSTMRWDLDRTDGYDFTYGRVEIRAAVDAGKGTGPALLLWPFDNTWPPEIDILETPDGARRSAWFTNHWPGPDGEDRYHSVQFKSVDSTPFDTAGTQYYGTNWNTYVIDWLPGKVIYHLNGTKLYETPAGEPVSAMPMSLGLQMFVAASNDSWYGGGPSGSPRKVNTHLDYVRVYESAATKVEQERGTATNATATISAAAAEEAIVVREATAPTDRGPPGLSGAREIVAAKVSGTPADEVLVGGPAADVFVLRGGGDRVENFAPGIDRLLVTGEPAQVKTFFVEEGGPEVLKVLYGDGLNVVTLPGVSMLETRDIVFA